MSAEFASDLKDTLTLPVTLVGMMGCGKSHLGSALSEALTLPFHDSDKIIEAKAGQSISDIFDLFGETKFREVERSTILELLGAGPAVIATGGGSLTNPETLEALKAGSIIIWLDVDLETLWERVQKSQNRPLLETNDPKGKLEELLDQRRGLYEQAHVQLSIGGESPQKTLEALIKALYEYVNAATV